MSKISCNAWCIDNIVEIKLVDEGTSFQQQRQRLSDPA